MIKQVLILFFISTTWLYSQTKEDSLWRNWKNESLHDSIRFQSISDYTYLYLFKNLDSAKIMIYDLYREAEKKKNLSYQGRALSLYGSVFFMKTNYLQALKYHKLSLIFYKKAKNKKEILRANYNLGIIYYHQGKIKEAYRILKKNIEHTKNTYPDLYVYNLEVILYLLEDIKYHEEALKRAKELHGVAAKHNYIMHISRANSIIAKILIKQNQIQKAKKILKENINYGNSQNIHYHNSISKLQLAEIYNTEKKYDSTLIVLKQGYSTIKELGDKRLNSIYLYQMADILRIQKKYDQALENAKKSFLTLKGTGNVLELNASLQVLSKIYKETGEYQKASKYAEMRTIYYDSLFNQSNRNALFGSEIQKENKNKLLKDSMDFIQNKKIQELKHSYKIQTRENYFLASLITTILLLILIIILIYYFLKNKSNLFIIEKQQLHLEVEREKEEIREQMMFFILEKTEDIVLTLNYSFEIIYINPSGKKIIENLYYSHPTLFLEKLFPRDFLNRNKRRIQKDSLVQEIEFEKPNGEWQSYLVSMVHQNSENEGYISMILRDINQIKAYEREIIRKNKQLNELNSELDKFVFTTSHDMRTPLVSITYLLEICKKQLKNPDLILERYLDNVRFGIFEIENMLVNILEYSKINKKELYIEQIDFESLIEQIKNSLKKEPNYSEVLFEYVLEEQEKFYNDSFQITTLLKNILQNSYKFQHKEKLKKEVHLNVLINSDLAKITIDDTGVGIKQEEKKHLTEMFYRGTNSASGLGLGLYNTRMSLDRLKGKITIDSIKEFGTQVEVNIPNKYKSISKNLKIEDAVFRN